MASQRTSPRSIKLRSLFTGVIKGEKKIEGNNAKLFLEAICDQEKPDLCIQKIQASEYGRAAFQTALSSSTELVFLQSSVTAILRYLSAPELKTLCGGAVLQQIVLNFVEADFVWNALKDALKSGQLAGTGEDAFSWLLLELLSLPKERAIAFVPLAQNNEVRERLLSSNVQDVRLKGQRIMHIVENLIAGHSARPGGPGGRHDNDFSEISKIAILPTADELSARNPYLPRAHDTDTLAQRPDGLAFHIDGQFRLLREDMLREMREEIQIALNIRKGQRRAFLIEHLSMVGVHCDGRNHWSVKLQCMNDLSQMPKKSERARRQFLKDNPKYLKHESLTCMVGDDEVITLGTLIREEDLLVLQPPVICVQIPGADSHRVLRCIKGAKVVKLIQLSTAVFSYAPILKQLKEIKEMPFEHEILRWTANSRPEGPLYQPSPLLMDLIQKMLRNPSLDIQDALKLPYVTKLDKSQAACFITGILHRLSTILGPPGEPQADNRRTFLLIQCRDWEVFHWRSACKSYFLSLRRNNSDLDLPTSCTGSIH
jgi:hypothetical protein